MLHKVELVELCTFGPVQTKRDGQLAGVHLTSQPNITLIKQVSQPTSEHACGPVSPSTSEEPISPSESWQARSE